MPLAVFIVLSAVLGIGLGRDPRAIPSPLINKPAPSFRLAELHDPARTFGPEQLRGKVWLLNVWASWCVSCRMEHRLLSALARTNVVPIYGIAYKDSRGNALAFLSSYGNPYVLSVQDADGRVGIDFGVYGVPESYVIDKTGVIRFKQIGPVTLDVLRHTIVPLIARLNQ
jgi:cytochrome c biogenesis protein CcmG/thiol:disulfide interchange protein DsbE